MTPAELADLAESMVPVAQRLVGAVHDDGPAQVGRILGEVPAEHLPALLVVLAAMVDPDRSAADSLAWIDWDENVPVVHDDSLFEGVIAEASVPTAPPHTDPKTWPDEMVTAMHSGWRRRQRGNGDPMGNPVLERAGYLEHNRRRKADARAAGNSPTAAAAGQESRRRAVSTRVSSGHG